MFYKKKFESRFNSSIGIEIDVFSSEVLTQNHEYLRPSTRDYFSILWFKEGTGQYVIDFKTYSFQPNTIVFLSKEQLHFFKEPNTNFAFLEISFTGEFMSQASNDLLLMISFCMREHFEGKQILFLSSNDTHYLTEIVSQMQEIILNWDDDGKKESLFHMSQLFLIYCRKLQNQQETQINNSKSAVYNDLIGSFTALLEQNFKKTQKVSFYCDNLNITYNSLAKKTKSYCDKNPKEIIAERVALEAKRLLSSSSLPIKEITYELGFDEPTNFVKFFKKIAGLTPAQFRSNYSVVTP